MLDAFAVQDISIVLGNPVKMGLGLISIGYCVALALQHYVLYARRSTQTAYEVLSDSVP